MIFYLYIARLMYHLLPLVNSSFISFPIKMEFIPLRLETAAVVRMSWEKIAATSSCNEHASNPHFDL